jgi:hypothetical protein
LWKTSLLHLLNGLQSMHDCILHTLYNKPYNIATPILYEAVNISAAFMQH